MDEHLADDGMVSAARADRAAFAQVYRRYEQVIYRYLLTKVNNWQDAQDLTAQTFAAALQIFDDYRADGSLVAWLTVIARNLAVSHYRRQRYEISLDDDTPLSTPGTEEIVGQRLRMAAVLEGLNRLQPERAEVIRLRLFAELSTAETARVMNKTEGAVKMLLLRALRDLRQHVVREETGE
ncbi:MAG: sigma-70 family RNA polymerase sigma factor [Chloroflexota bacterium]